MSKNYDLKELGKKKERAGEKVNRIKIRTDKKKVILLPSFFLEIIISDLYISVRVEIELSKRNTILSFFNF